MPNEDQLAAQTAHWVTLGGFFQRFSGEDHACIPLPAWRALMALWGTFAGDVSSDKAAQIVIEARQAYLRDVLGWDEARVQAYEIPPASWVYAAVERALSSKAPPSKVGPLHSRDDQTHE
jgi:hypothetical protein